MRKLFDAAQDDIVKLMRDDTFPRFLQSAEYTNLIAAHKDAITAKGGDLGSKVLSRIKVGLSKASSWVYGAQGHGRSGSTASVVRPAANT